MITETREFHKLTIFCVVFCTFIFLLSATAFAIDRTESEAVSWVLGLVDSGWGSAGNTPNYDGSKWLLPSQGDEGEPQCVDLTAAYFDYLIGWHWGISAYQYEYLDLPEGLSYSYTPHKGDVVVWGQSNASPYGHVGVIYEVSGSSFWWVDTRGDNNYYIDSDGYRHNTGATKRGPSSSATVFIHPDFKPSEVHGSYMETGYERVLPDGDYLIAAAGTSDKSTFYYLDISGSDYPAASETVVSLCGPLYGDAPVYEIWTLTYSSYDKFYTICQKGTNMCLDVDHADTTQGGKIQVYPSNEGSSQKWAISHNGKNGYRLQPQCSGAGENGMCLDIDLCEMRTGAKVQQYKINNTDAQSWLFIPYQPEQTLENGRYILLSGVDTNWELDVPGDSGDVADQTVVQLCQDTALSQYNAFDITKLDNGYYSVIHAASGKALEVYGGGSDTETNASLLTPNGSNTQQWAITNNGYNGGYTLQVKSSGYALDLANAMLIYGARVRQYPWNGSQAETWVLIPAEYTVSYQANGGTNAPASQIKYYKGKLLLSSTEPTRADASAGSYTVTLDANGGTVSPASLTAARTTKYTFKNWNTAQNGSGTSYDPGASYTTDAALTLYAQWNSSTTTAAVTLPAPSRSNALFLGWAASAEAEVQYQAGDTLTPTGNMTLCAVWFDLSAPDGVLPAALKELEDEALAGCAFRYVKLPEGMTTIGARVFADSPKLRAVYIPASVTTIAGNAFDGAPDGLLIVGEADSYAEFFASRHGLGFID